jgi:lipopolysaccharide/colanic/teichoic acid biosynthesis glycosyltransferase
MTIFKETSSEYGLRKRLVWSSLAQIRSPNEETALMFLRKWDDLPDNMKNESVRKYFYALHKKRCSLFIKRLFDVVVGSLLLIVLLPVFLIISIAIKTDSKSPVLFRQVRVTQYGKQFRIFKFRTMVNNADKIGAKVTTINDTRITKVGIFLRKYRLDEIPQLLNIIMGDMSFVGTRPEVVKYVNKYTDEMAATLLLPAGVTSEASIHYKNEEKLLVDIDNVDKIYVEIVLPEKMKFNLDSIEYFSLMGELKTMFRTVWAVFKGDKVTKVVEEKMKIYEVK